MQIILADIFDHIVQYIDGFNCFMHIIVLFPFKNKY